ncbi:bifunctional adenosylcobinamide kinase/adenosylcobinamide-phosphate guanylyltransferase [Prochlorococcus sp. MIT 1307]|uniref:bifunctional adenosylcobinamide kinase/adenosylcobinamide-phosphate guanylyltransferase n=1 Tax=Prochlorococcus sp. MIT 1307 TaxID=3096219 RepID=UPI002A760F1B|nr:bifunctional adenosylcobinamide kinase/adenosylcobinamide-phosphate guanylyltransferase [Prochlorococcus sp. MIT 1307]
MKEGQFSGEHNQLMQPLKILVSGPSRSGKSIWAEKLIHNFKDITYVATAVDNITDADMHQRIKLHRLRRPKEWQLLEYSKKSENILTQLSSRNIIFDSLGGFVSLHINEENINWSNKSRDFVMNFRNHNKHYIIVIEETGWGVVPPTRLGGLFRDRLGLLAQELENYSQQSWLVVQGRAIDLHKISVPIS